MQDIHNFDSSTIPAAWHGWLHHQHDEPPTEQFPAPPNLTISASSRDDSPYHNHFGLKHKDIPEGNKSVYRPVGYGYGNLYQKWGEKEVWNHTCYHVACRVCSRLLLHIYIYMYTNSKLIVSLFLLFSCVLRASTRLQGTSSIQGIDQVEILAW